MFSVVYHPEAREEATALPVKIRVKFDRLIGKLEYDARLLREPDTKPLIDRNLKPKKIKKTPKNGCLFNTACVP